MASPAILHTPIEDDDLPPCVICQSPITEKAVLRPCCHSYDYGCIRTWLEIRPLCPLCKGTVEFLDLHGPEARVTRRFSVTSTAHFTRPFSARCHIYHQNLRTAYIGATPLSRFPPLTPETFIASAVLQSRARTFITRELDAVFPLLTRSPNSPGADFLLMYAVTLLKFVDINEDGGRVAEGLLKEYMGRRAVPARVFLHEVAAFLRSGCETPEEFDRLARYAPAEDSAEIEVPAGATAAATTTTTTTATTATTTTAAATAAAASESRSDERRVEGYNESEAATAVSGKIEEG